MPHVQDPREGQSVQRRVSYRKLRDDDDDDDDAKATCDKEVQGYHERRSVSVQAPLGLGGVDHQTRDSNAVDEYLDGGDLTAVYPSLMLLTTPTSIWHEAWMAIRDGAWFIAFITLLATVLCVCAVVHFTSDVGSRGAADSPHLPARRIPSPDEQSTFHDVRMRGATTMHTGAGTVILQGLTATSSGKYVKLPDQFYQGIHIGLSAWDKWGEKLSDRENVERNAALKEALEQLDPRPAAVYATTFEGGAEGVTVAFTAGILGKREGRSVRDRSDAIWSAAENAVLTVARRFQQLVVMKWHPKVWGPGHEKSTDMHTSILQEVLPTRTGLRALGSIVAVYHVPRSTPVEASHPPAAPTR